MIFIFKKTKQEGKKEPYILAETTVITDRKKWKSVEIVLRLYYSTIHTQFQNPTFQKLDNI